MNNISPKINIKNSNMISASSHNHDKSSINQINQKNKINSPENNLKYISNNASAISNINIGEKKIWKNLVQYGTSNINKIKIIIFVYILKKKYKIIKYYYLIIIIFSK